MRMPIFLPCAKRGRCLRGNRRRLPVGHPPEPYGSPSQALWLPQLRPPGNEPWARRRTLGVAGRRRRLEAVAHNHHRCPGSDLARRRCIREVQLQCAPLHVRGLVLHVSQAPWRGQNWQQGSALPSAVLGAPCLRADPLCRRQPPEERAAAVSVALPSLFRLFQRVRLSGVRGGRRSRIARVRLSQLGGWGAGPPPPAARVGLCHPGGSRRRIPDTLLGFRTVVAVSAARGAVAPPHRRLRRLPGNARGASCAGRGSPRRARLSRRERRGRRRRRRR